MQALRANPVATDLWDARLPTRWDTSSCRATASSSWSHRPARTSSAKLANGLANDLLSTLCLARECPLLVAPAMNRQMWDNAATQRNVAGCAADGVTILGPASGDQACGEVGMGRMLEAAELFEAMLAALQPRGARGRAWS